MSKGKGIFKLVEENPQGTQNSSVGSDKNMIISNEENEEKKDEENINESNIDSNKDLKSKKKAKTARETRKNFAQEIIEEKRKERTMRAKIDKIYIETERLTKKFEEKNSFIHLFNNNPQYQNMLMQVEKKIIYNFIEGTLLMSFSILLYFYYANMKDGIQMASFIISLVDISLCILLYIFLKLGILNDPNLSKAFRCSVVIESISFIASFVINIIAGIMSIKKVKKKKNQVIFYILFISIIIFFIFIFKNWINLLVESLLILFKRKTEYSILLLQEKNRNKNEINFDTNSTTDNNMTYVGLVDNSKDVFNIDNNKKNEQANKEEQQYNVINYFKKFHYNVHSNRNEDFYNLMRKK